MSLNTLNQADLVFVVDTTGSMGMFIEDAKKQLTTILAQIQAKYQLDLQVGLVEFRDHPPEENTFVTREYPLTADLDLVKKNIQRLAASGGGDTPEAVIDGLSQAATKMAWRDQSLHLLILVGDAPPHGMTNDDRHGQDGYCLCNRHYSEVVAEIEKAGCVFLTIVTDSYGVTEATFKKLSDLCGGDTFALLGKDSVIQKIQTVLSKYFDFLELDQKVLEIKTSNPIATCPEIAAAINPPVSRQEVAKSFARLGRRKLI